MSDEACAVYASVEIQEILKQGTYLPVPLSGIRYKSCPRTPRERAESLFFNARNTRGFEDAKMAELEDSIAAVGLIQPMAVRLVEHADGVPFFYELVWGERRTRALRVLVAQDRDVWDEARGLVRRASLVYENVTCRVLAACDDERAIGLAFAENDERVPLAVADVIDLCLHLERRGYNQKQIGVLLKKQPSWVCETFQFESCLPPQAYEMLREGRISRDYGVLIMEQPESLRLELTDLAMQIAADRYREKVAAVEEELLEIDGILLESEADVIVSDDKPPAAQRRARKKLERAQAEADAVILKDERIKKKGVVPRPSDLDAAIKLKGLRSRKGLSAKAIYSRYVERIASLEKDPETGKPFRRRDLGIAKAVAVGIAEGEKDLALLLRGHYLSQGYWDGRLSPESGLPEPPDDFLDDEDEDEDEDEDDEEENEVEDEDDPEEDEDAEEVAEFAELFDDDFED